ncbi:MAG: hypothetical protein ACRDV7_14110 [Acidimicrobiia bacterium]
MNNPDVTRLLLEAPWSAARACIDAYETGIRIATDIQLTVARTVRLEPIRSVAATTANLTRDIGATQLSAARWFLDA